MEKVEKKIAIDAKKIKQANFEIEKAHYNEIELEKKTINEELERSKRYLVEEVLQDGESLLAEIDRKEKKSFLSRLIDFIFK